LDITPNNESKTQKKATKNNILISIAHQIEGTTKTKETEARRHVMSYFYGI